MISTYNPCDFGTRGIQFIADFSFDEELRRNSISKDCEKWYLSDNFLRRIYLKLCDLISPIKPEAWKKDLVVANSYWTAELMREKYGVESRVIYPPVIGCFPNVSYGEKEGGFVCIGRIVPEKGIDSIIKILERVRQKGHNIHFHIIGGIIDNRYGRSLKELFQKHQKWVFLDGWLGEKKKKEIIVRHHFGISGCRNEAFGIAVAEMIKGGCIVFVPSGGGQVEIINHPSLIYENEEDAVEKIETVLENKKIQDDLHQHLSLVSQTFSIENFQKEIKNIISEFFRRNIIHPNEKK
jgi:glycosyltransferase involved in cell wall biosynthesis